MKFLLLFLPLLLLVPITVDAAQTQYGIALSQTCLKMISNDLQTDCPNYIEIMRLFPDGTDQRYSGEFKNIDGLYQRDTPRHLNPWKYYYFASSPVLWIDPPGNTRDRIKMIYIEPSIPEYKLGFESTRMDDYSVSFGKDRWINENCSVIKVTAKNWVFLTGDSINILKHNCDLSVSQFTNGTVTKTFAKSYQDIKTSYKYQHDKWVAENLIKCKTKGC